MSTLGLTRVSFINSKTQSLCKIILYCIFNNIIIAGFVGTPSGVTPPSHTDTKYVVTNLTCTNTFECTNTTGYSGCSSYGGGYAAITCGRCMSPTTCVCLFVTLTLCPSIHLINACLICLCIKPSIHSSIRLLLFNCHLITTCLLSK